jgi:hypothetical protein
MNRKLAIIIGLQALLIIMLFWLMVFYGKDEYETLSQDSTEEIDAPNRVTTEAGVTIISVNMAAQKQSEIKTSALKASSHTKSISSYGNVLSIDSLIDLRTRYLAAKAEAEVLSTSSAHYKAEYKRMLLLNQDNKNVSDKALASALADMNASEAKIYAAELNANNVAASMRQAWGVGLAKLAIEKNAGSLLQNLISYQEVLLQITLPFDAAEPTSSSQLSIAPTTAITHSIAAQYISPAPTSSATIQGKTYFYHAKATDLRAGMQIKVLSAQSKGGVNGVIVPNTAVIWYGGKPWVYQKLGVEKFSRIPIKTDIEFENGWFNKGKLQANDEVVTSGAQLLLSEEFKSQITNENED